MSAHEVGARDATALVPDPAPIVTEVLAVIDALHDAHRQEALRARVERSLAGARAGAASEKATELLVEAFAAQAEDALHGANQLSLSAQRAPTCEACDDGWRRVEAIVAGAERAAGLAASTAAGIERALPGTGSARKAVKAVARARHAAAQARRIVEQRNHAYTFHADRNFSFGEGWYLAAAGVLAGVIIQIEPAASGTEHVERFLLEAGLTHAVTAYRSRPRAMKQATTLVARAFRRDPLDAQRRLRAAFLGAGSLPSAVAAWVEQRLAFAPAGAKVLLWIRTGAHDPHRNTQSAELAELKRRVLAEQLVPVFIGDALPDASLAEHAVDLTFFWKDPLFQGADMRRCQLQFFEHLKQRYGLIGQLGVTTAGMDGPALLGLPTLYFTDATNPRMSQWVGAVPGYEEVVRDGAYLTRVTETLRAWPRPTVPARSQRDELP